MTIINLKNGKELAEITSQNLWVLLKFSAIWCQPCQHLETVFNSLMEKRSELPAVKVNVDLQPELTRQYAIRSVPTLLLLKQGQIVSQLSGLHNEAQLQNWLDQHVQTASTKGE